MAKKGRRIGLVDDNLDNFHAKVYLDIVRNKLARAGFTIVGATALKRKASRAWAAERDLPFYDSVADLDPHVDYYMVLAPGTPQTHLGLCRQVFPFGKTTYVDKTFAPDLATAKKIFALADRHRVKMQTTSALRYTSVQEYVREIGRARVRHMVTWGGGRSFHEYAIHQTELAVSCMGAKAEGLMRRGAGKHNQLLVNFSGGRTAVINTYIKARTPYAASVTTADETRFIPCDTSRLFIDTMAAILDFFKSARPNIDRAESLTVRRILDAAGAPRALKQFVRL